MRFGLHIVLSGILYACVCVCARAHRYHTGCDEVPFARQSSTRARCIKPPSPTRCARARACSQCLRANTHIHQRVFITCFSVINLNKLINITWTWCAHAREPSQPARSTMYVSARILCALGLNNTSARVCSRMQ